MFDPAVVPKDVWYMIGHDLSIKSLLNLRAVSRRLNEIVISMQSRWYRAHQWLVSGMTKRRVKCAVRVHTAFFGPRCMNSNFEFPGRKELGLPSGNLYNWTQRSIFDNAVKKLIEDGEITDEKCECRWHCSMKVPQSENEIPLDHHFKPKQNHYIYHYLIESYRKLKPEHDKKINAFEHSILCSKRAIRNAEEVIVRSKHQLKKHEEELIRERKKFKQNDIFAGYKINAYKTPAQQRRQQQQTKGKNKAESKK